MRLQPFRAEMSDLLIITNSYDATTDLLIERLEGQPIFRLNFDQITHYKIRFDASGFRISDPTGRSLSSTAVRKAYWRKPFNGSQDAHSTEAMKYVDAEMRYVLTELANLLWAEQKFVLVEPFAERRTGKLLQLCQARYVFRVPEYEFLLNEEPSASEAVVKSLSNELIGNKVLYSTRAHTSDLDQHYPWLLQQYVPASHDVTVVFVRGQVFAFSLKRDFLDKSIDWRRFISPNQKWSQHTLPESVSKAITAYMNTLSLDFGRLDFLLDEEQQYWFCEVNPNGQYAWLDLVGSHGVMDAVTREISPSSQIHPIRRRHPLESAFSL